jgi:hypothetical protein
MRIAALLLAAVALHAQPTFRLLHVTSAGIIADDSGNPVALRGLNRSSTGSGNAEATSTDAEYAAQNHLLSMNLVRIFVNAAWWTNNVQVPIANLNYQSYIDELIQRAKKYGNYVLISESRPVSRRPLRRRRQELSSPQPGRSELPGQRVPVRRAGHHGQ